MGSYGDVLSHFNESGALSGDVVSRSEAEELSVRVAELEDEVRGASLPLPLPNPRKASSFSQIVFGGGVGFFAVRCLFAASARESCVVCCCGLQKQACGGALLAEPPCELQKKRDARTR